MNTLKPLTKVPGQGSLVRPRYFPGLLLEDEDLTAAVDYSRNLSRLIVRSLFGCGVACGLGVRGELVCEKRHLQVTVSPGVAFDCLGNPIEVKTPQVLVYDPECQPMPHELWVVACFVEKCCRPAELGCEGEDDATPGVAYRRSLDGYELQLLGTPPACACACVKPPSEPASSAGQGCCADAEASADAQFAAAAAGAGSTSPYLIRTPPCDCYPEDAPCGCECDCSCVLLGYMTIDVAKDLVETYRGAVRSIRPMLLAARACYDTPLETHEPELEFSAALAVRSDRQLMTLEGKRAQQRLAGKRLAARVNALVIEEIAARTTFDVAQAAAKAAPSDAEAAAAAVDAERKAASIAAAVQTAEREHAGVERSMKQTEALLMRERARIERSQAEARLERVDRALGELQPLATDRSALKALQAKRRELVTHVTQLSKVLLEPI